MGGYEGVGGGKLELAVYVGCCNAAASTTGDARV